MSENEGCRAEKITNGAGFDSGNGKYQVPNAAQAQSRAQSQENKTFFKRNCFFRIRFNILHSIML